MNVEVKLNGRTYRYINVGISTTWVNEDNIIVPVMMHTKLRETAIASGIDSSVFVNIVVTKIEVDKKECKTTNIKKNSLKGINPFEAKE